MAIDAEQVKWAYRFLIGREPNQPETDLHLPHYADLEQLRTAFLCTPEAHSLFNTANIRGGGAYTIPAFLLRAPDHPGVRWEFRTPDLAHPCCQLCTSEQMQSPEYAALCAVLQMDPTLQHRKLWEYAYIVAALQFEGCLLPGARGLGFGTGREPLPSAFAARGIRVTATDAPADLGSSAHWAGGAQWTQGLADLFVQGMLPEDAFRALVEYRPADMNAIPPDLRGYDFCWSACCLEHLGSLRHGLDFIHNSLDALRPGGVAVHTTEFNLSSNQHTMETEGLSLFRKCDLELLAHELAQAGHEVAPLNFWPGATPVDEHIDLPPFGFPHLKLELMGYVTTSVGLIVRKGAGRDQGGAPAPGAAVPRYAT